MSICVVLEHSYIYAILNSCSHMDGSKIYFVLDLINSKSSTCRKSFTINFFFQLNAYRYMNSVVEHYEKGEDCMLSYFHVSRIVCNNLMKYLQTIWLKLINDRKFILKLSFNLCNFEINLLRTFFPLDLSKSLILV